MSIFVVFQRVERYTGRPVISGELTSLQIRYNVLITIDNLPSNPSIPADKVLDWYAEEYAFKRDTLSGDYVATVQYDGTIEGWKHTAESQKAESKI